MQVELTSLEIMALGAAGQAILAYVPEAFALRSAVNRLTEALYAL